MSGSARYTCTSRVRSGENSQVSGVAALKDEERRGSFGTNDHELSVGRVELEGPVEHARGEVQHGAEPRADLLWVLANRWSGAPQGHCRPGAEQTQGRARRRSHWRGV